MSQKAFRLNKLNELLLNDKPALGAWLVYREPLVAVAASRLGYDFVCIDMQHGVQDFSDVGAILSSILLGSSTPVVRMPSTEPSLLGRVLDAGALAVILPMINSKADAEAAVRACRYAPAGERSIGATAAATYYGEEYYDLTDRETAVIPMIETAQALDDIDGILGVEGVEVAFVGPYDLSTSLGLAIDSAQFADVLAGIVAACERHGVVPGIYGSADNVEKRYRQGFRMISVAVDEELLVRNLTSVLQTSRTAVTQ